MQYDVKTNTIADNLRKQSELGNPILATLKAKRGIQSEVGFGSKPPTQSTKTGGKVSVDKPENFLGPGYYEQKSGFSKYQGAPPHAIIKNNSQMPQSKSCGNFMSSAPRWQDPKASKSKMN